MTDHIAYDLVCVARDQVSDPITIKPDELSMFIAWHLLLVVAKVPADETIVLEITPRSVVEVVA